MAQFNPLRPIVQRLTSTQPPQLPSVAHFLASSIANCSDTLRSASLTSTAGDETTVLVHRLKTKISSLLQDRSAEARFTGIILVKAFIEAAGRDALEACEPWLRSLITLLGRAGPSSHKKLCLIVVTRIFLLTQPHQTLVREITTPLLPGFITTSLNLVKPNSVRNVTSNLVSPSLLLEPVLRCLLELIPYHPAIFRPFLSRIKPILLSLISNVSTPCGVSEAAGELFAMLHFCAPKNNASSEWVQTCKAVITSCHGAADVAFAAVIEDWKLSNYDGGKSGAKPIDVQSISKEPNDSFPLKLDGIHEAASSIKALLKILRNLVCGATAQAVGQPIGLIVDLSFRITSVHALSGSNGHQFPLRLNPEVGRDERDSLWMELPSIHVEVLNLLLAMFNSYAHAMRPVAEIIMRQALTIFNAEKRDRNIRTSAYNLLDQLFSIDDSLIKRSDMRHLRQLISDCCAELLPETEKFPVQKLSRSSETRKARTNGSTSIDADLLLKTQKNPTRAVSTAEFSAAYQAASRLLPRFITNLRPGTLSRESRTEIDRTSILVQNREAMLASVLSPPPLVKGHSVSPSIMPFFAREVHGNLLSEALLRPRMPVIHDTEFVADDSESGSDEQVENTDFLPRPSKGTEVLDQLDYATDTSAIEWMRPKESEKFPTAAMLNSETGNRNDDISNPAPVSKRTFEVFAVDEGHDMTGSIAYSAKISSPDVNEESVKKPRLEASLVMSAPSEMQEKHDGAHPEGEISSVHWSEKAFGKIGAANQEDNHVDRGISETHQAGSTGMVDAEDDESDFEIPTIDPELSTDEEGESEFE